MAWSGSHGLGGGHGQAMSAWAGTQLGDSATVTVVLGQQAAVTVACVHAPQGRQAE